MIFFLRQHHIFLVYYSGFWYKLYSDLSASTLNKPTDCDTELKHINRMNNVPLYHPNNVVLIPDLQPPQALRDSWVNVIGMLQRSCYPNEMPEPIPQILNHDLIALRHYRYIAPIIADVGIYNAILELQEAFSRPQNYLQFSQILYPQTSPDIYKEIKTLDLIREKKKRTVTDNLQFGLLLWYSTDVIYILFHEVEAARKKYAFRIQSMLDADSSSKLCMVLKLLLCISENPDLKIGLSELSLIVLLAPFICVISEDVYPDPAGREIMFLCLEIICSLLKDIGRILADNTSMRLEATYNLKYICKSLKLLTDEASDTLFLSEEFKDGLNRYQNKVKPHARVLTDHCKALAAAPRKWPTTNL